MEQNKSVGTIYVVKQNSLVRGWRPVEQFYVEGKRRQKTLAGDYFRAVGFSERMTIEQAKEKARQLNAERSIQRKKMREAAAKVAEKQIIDKAYMPEAYVAEFEPWFIDFSSGSEKHKKKLMSNWRTAQKIIIKLKIHPRDYFDNRKKLYKEFEKNAYSYDYSCKLIRPLNLYCRFVSKIENFYFEQIPAPKGYDRDNIQESFEREKPSKEAIPLTPRNLEKLRAKMTPENYKWMHISLVFGLRPSEVDSLLDSNHRYGYQIEPDENDIDILWIYQDKLRKIRKDQRWKGIPVLTDLQKEGLSFILEGEFSRPLPKTIQKYLRPGYHTYSGRKGFEDLMAREGQDERHISRWLGHQNIRTTNAHYRNKRRADYTL